MADVGHVITLVGARWETIQRTAFSDYLGFVRVGIRPRKAEMLPMSAALTCGNTHGYRPGAEVQQLPPLLAKPQVRALIVDQGPHLFPLGS